jgi:hypothetical protein
MNPLEKLALKLSLTKAEVSLISILLGFLLLGGRQPHPPCHRAASNR